MDARRKKLTFRANHRGFKEMDLIMGHFADAHIASLSDEELGHFEALLEAPDQDVYSWIVGDVDVPSDYQTSLLKRLQTFDVASILNKSG